MKLIKGFLIGALVLSFAACSKKDEKSGGDGVGNGGDATAIQFRKIAESAIDKAEANDIESFNINYKLLRERLKTADISSTESRLELDGDEKDAINYPFKQKIVVNSRRFGSYREDALKQVLALHEVFGLVGIQDENFEKSSRLIAYDPVTRKEIMKKIDVLFVIDDSGSMAIHQENLAKHIEFFLKNIEDQKADYHIGVITTSGNFHRFSDCQVGVPATLGRCKREDGRIIGGVITPFVAGTLDRLRQVLVVGTGGNGTETPYQQIINSFTLGHPENLGFYRPEANLEIVIVTDAGEQSEISGVGMAAFLAALKPGIEGQRKISVSLFLPLPGDRSCQADTISGENPSAYDKYYDVITPFYGSIYNLCQRSIAEGVDTFTQDVHERLNQ